jgi:predicted outer membrane repeat protein
VLGAGTYSGPFSVTKPVVILGSELGDAVLTAPDSLRVLEISADATLEDLVFRGGRLAGTAGETANWTAPDSLGAAMYVHDASVVVRRSRFTQNDAWGGGAIWVRDSDTRFEGCDFDSNTAVVTGGAVLADSSSVVSFLGCTFVDNASRGEGGALTARADADLNLTTCTSRRNTSAARGGSLAADSSSTVTLDQSLFAANVSLGNGGAVHGTDATVDAERTRFTGNAAAHGGAVWLAGAASTFATCDFDSNSTSGAGGAMFVDSTSTVTVTNALLHHNTAALDGGALFARGASVHLETSTFADNVADSSGGAIFVDEGDSLSVRAVILVGNIASGADSEDGIRCSGPTLLECLVFWDQMQDSLGCDGGSDLLIADPLFCDRAAADYHLDVTSPCTAENAPAGCGRIGSEQVACGVVDVGATSAGARLVLGAPRPNPAHGAARIAFEIPARQDVRLRVFDVSGRVVATLVAGALDAGAHTLTWDGRDTAGHRVSPGVYFYRLEAGARQISRKLVIVR